jgi:hypothetical protein
MTAEAERESATEKGSKMSQMGLTEEHKRLRKRVQSVREEECPLRSLEGNQQRARVRLDSLSLSSERSDGSDGSRSLTTRADTQRETRQSSLVHSDRKVKRRTTRAEMTPRGAACPSRPSARRGEGGGSLSR